MILFDTNLLIDLYENTWIVALELSEQGTFSHKMSCLLRS